ncbi:MAG: selenocysteine-specific translation elongation factor [Desulfobacterales bacterium]|jgi:selenocysteine-specific elongation factor|nr:selenocysteine-specific translation elongation factor [Desulfobacterales bacterium]
MKQIILGTAGHIDHGKTSLVRALTGIDTDRLKEEKERGITIELGFAHLDLPGGQHLGVVDVPGHEKFVKNMVAGATGIDIVAMVIAADEGVMPQTREHMEICTLLGVRHGLVALTKVDMVDEEMLELAQEDIREFARGSFLEDAPILPVSAVSGQGLPEFIAALDQLSRQVPDRPASSLFRLPVDRVFTMKGFGTVITGTLVSGRVQVGDPIMIYPTGITSKVRGIQVHNLGVQAAEAGQRTAVNFQGLDKEAISRGDVLASPQALKPSYMVDVHFRYLASNAKPMKNRTRVRFHTGTSEILGNLILLEQDELAPGAETVAQLRLDAPVAIVKGDHFVVRSYSPVRTTGGGQILNPIPPKHKRLKPEIVAGLKSILDRGPEQLIGFHVEAAGPAGVAFADLRLMTSLTDKQLDSALQAMMSSRTVIQVDKEARSFIHRKSLEELIAKSAEHLRGYHKAFPLKTGMLKEELKSKFPPEADIKIFNLVLNQMIKDSAIVAEDKLVRLKSHKVSLAGDEAGVRRKILEIYRTSGLQPPFFREVVETLKADPGQAKDVLLLLIEEGRIVRTKDDLYFDAEAIQDLRARLVKFLERNGEITPAQFKEMTGGASRKFLIPLFEYFDAKNVTLRVGDVRKLRRG